MTASVSLPICRQGKCAHAVSGSPASVTGPEGLVPEPDTPGQRVATQMGSSLSQGSGSGVHDRWLRSRQQSSLSCSGDCQGAAVRRHTIDKLRLLQIALM